MKTIDAVGGFDKELELQYNVANISNKDFIFGKWVKILEKIK